MLHTNHLTYEFGPYRFCLAQRALTRDGEPIALTPKAFEILTRLVVNAGQLLEKDDLLKEVWPDTFVEEANLTQYIFTLRRALGDERSGPRYIETVSRRGYRFVADVRVCDAEAPPSPTAPAEPETQPPGAETDEVVSPPPVVAVLPFFNETGDEGLEYLAEGVTDNIINNLSRVSRLRVMSRSAVFRRNARAVDAQGFGKELGATAVLVGKITSRPAALGSVEPGMSVPLGGGANSGIVSGSDAGGRGVAATARGVGSAPASDLQPVGKGVAALGGSMKAVLAISVELVDVATGWLMWGDSFDCESRDLLQIQDAITRQLLVNLKLKLTGEEEKRVTARYTENAQAYQAYLEGRYHWSRYTRKGIETAIKNFRRAIELDSNYALAYAAIVDCYLRLATNYLPPEEDFVSQNRQLKDDGSSSAAETNLKIKLRFEWDLKGAERELRRANELNANYPAAHQWYAAYRFAQRLFASTIEFKNKEGRSIDSDVVSPAVLDQLVGLQLTPNEHVQIYCAIARDQIDIGNYDAASEVLKSRWVFGQWPKLNDLTQESCADLLFTAGELAGCVASSKQLRRGQKHGEALLSGSIAIFEQLCSKRRSAEGCIELALCYYRQGMFDLGRSTLLKVLDSLSSDDVDLRSLALIRLACLERHAGRLKDALSYLTEAESLVSTEGPWASGRCYLELASTYKDLTIPGEISSYFENARECYRRALHEFEAVGNHRLCAIVENNLGILLFIAGHFVDCEAHLGKARRVFDLFDDRIRRAQVDDSLARLYLEQRKLGDALVAIEQSVQTMELGDEDALLAESLITKGLIYYELSRYNEAQKALDGAYRLASRCGDIEGAGRAVLIVIEKLSGVLTPDECRHIRSILLELLSSSQHEVTKSRVEKCLKTLDSLIGYHA